MAIRPFLLLCLLSTTAFSQTISGILKNDSFELVSGATIKILNVPDSGLFTNCVTDDKGTFSFKAVANHNYIVSIHHLGYQTIHKNFTASSSNMNIGIIVITKKTLDLQEIKIVANKAIYEQKIDRSVLNVSKDILALGNNALNILEKARGITINRQLNELTLNGNDNVMIMINGRPVRQSAENTLQMLAGTNAENIEKIELISNPPANFESGNNGGIINIILKRNTALGTNAIVSANAGYGYKEKAGLNFNVNHRSENIELNANLSYNTDKTRESIYNTRVISAAPADLISVTGSERYPVANNLSGKIGVDYNFDKKNSLGGIVSGYINNSKLGSDNTGLLDNNNFTASNSLKNNWNQLFNNLHFNHNFRQDEVFLFNVDYLHFKNYNPAYYSYNYFEPDGTFLRNDVITSLKNSTLNIIVAKADYENQINSNLAFKTGAQAISSVFRNDIVVAKNQQVEESLSSITKLKEKILGLYTSLEYKVDEKTRLNVGLRYEYTNSFLNVVNSPLNNNYGLLLPSAFFSKNLSDKLTINASYARKFTRPTYNEIIPYFIFLDPNTYFYGNVNLIPSKSNDFKIDLNAGKYLFSLQANFNKNAIIRFQPVLIDSNQVFTSLNLKYRNNYTALVNIPVKIKNWWDVNLSLTGLLKQLETDFNANASNFSYKINIVQQFKISPQVNMELSGFYQSKSLVGISSASDYQSVNFAVSKTIKTNHRIAFLCLNIFGFNYNVYTTPDVVSNYSTNTRYKYEGQIFKLVYTYSFGNKKLKPIKDKKTASEEIQQRLN